MPLLLSECMEQATGWWDNEVVKYVNDPAYSGYKKGQWNKNSRSVDAHGQETQQQESHATADHRGNKSPKQ